MKITVDYLREILEYNPETGVVHWKQRPRTDFTYSRNHKAWNNKHVGQEAGQVSNSDNRFHVSLFEKTIPLDKLIYALLTGEFVEQPIQHRNGWMCDNHADNLTLDKHPPKVYVGGDLVLTTDFIHQLPRHLILAVGKERTWFCFGIYESKKLARVRMLELADKLQCGFGVRDEE